MTKQKRTVALLIGTLVMGLLSWVVFAADHAEAPGASADPLADITDLYAWHDSTAGTLTAIIGFNPFAASESYDADLLYTISIDNDQDQTSDIDILIRFGQKKDDTWGVQIKNMPGIGVTLSGAVNTTITGDNKAKVFAGLVEDPFFFDQTGFNQTITNVLADQTGTDPNTLAFTKTDALAGANVQVVVLEMDLTSATGGSTNIDLWATTSRK